MVPALSSTVCINGIGTAAATAATDKPSCIDSPQVIGEVAHAGTQATQVIESDGRIGPAQVDVGVQVAQQTVGQPVRQGAQLLLGVLDDRPQRGITGDHLCPRQPADTPTTRDTWW